MFHYFTLKEIEAFNMVIFIFLCICVLILSIFALLSKNLKQWNEMGYFVFSDYA